MQNPSEDKLEHSSVTLFPPLDDDDGGISAHLAEKFHRITKRRRSQSPVISDDSEEEEIRQLALETAVIAHNEIQHMQNSIAELESLLERPEENVGDESDDLNGKVSRVASGESEILSVKSDSFLESGHSSEGSIASDD